MWAGTAVCTPCHSQPAALAESPAPAVLRSIFLHRDTADVAGVRWFIPRKLNGASAFELWLGRGGDKPRQVFTQEAPDVADPPRA